MLLVLNHEGHEVLATDTQMILAEQLFAGKKVSVTPENDLTQKAKQLSITGYTIYEATYNQKGGINELVRPLDFTNGDVLEEDKNYAAMFPTAGG